jgi:hypothetical protein
MECGLLSGPWLSMLGSSPLIYLHPPGAFEAPYRNKQDFVTLVFAE